MVGFAYAATGNGALPGIELPAACDHKALGTIKIAVRFMIGVLLMLWPLEIQGPAMAVAVPVVGASVPGSRREGQMP